MQRSPVSKRSRTHQVACRDLRPAKKLLLLPLGHFWIFRLLEKAVSVVWAFIEREGMDVCTIAAIFGGRSPNRIYQRGWGCYVLQSFGRDPNIECPRVEFIGVIPFPMVIRVNCPDGTRREVSGQAWRHWCLMRQNLRWFLIR